MTNQRTTDFSTLPPIMAVDFDGTLVQDEFPKIGEEKENMCDFIRSCQYLGIRTILWTSRTGEELKAAIEWCEDHDFHFTTVNENIPEVIELTGGVDTRKVYADVYIDDRNRVVDRDNTFIKDIIKDLMRWLGK